MVPFPIVDLNRKPTSIFHFTNIIVINQQEETYFSILHTTVMFLPISAARFLMFLEKYLSLTGYIKYLTLKHYA